MLFSKRMNRFNRCKDTDEPLKHNIEQKKPEANECILCNSIFGFSKVQNLAKLIYGDWSQDGVYPFRGSDWEVAWGSSGLPLIFADLGGCVHVMKIHQAVHLWSVHFPVCTFPFNKQLSFRHSYWAPMMHQAWWRCREHGGKQEEHGLWLHGTQSSEWLNELAVLSFV